METETVDTKLQALNRAIAAAGGKTALMRALNERGHVVNSHGTITQWQLNGVPAKYCPDIEDLTGVKCEQLCPETNWALLRKAPRRLAKAA
jgi:DNA-binding transcriptional regulator YdaS (Cro superfamily)